MNKNRILHGQALVEFAIIAPILILMTTVLFDLGRAVVDSSIINNAAREGTRWAAVQQGGGAPKDIVSQVKSYLLGLNPRTITVSQTNSAVCVYINYVYTPITPGVSSLLGKSKSLTLQTQSQTAYAPFAVQNSSSYNGYNGSSGHGNNDYSGTNQCGESAYNGGGGGGNGGGGNGGGYSNGGGSDNDHDADDWDYHDGGWWYHGGGWYNDGNAGYYDYHGDGWSGGWNNGGGSNCNGWWGWFLGLFGWGGC